MSAGRTRKENDRDRHRTGRRTLHQDNGPRNRHPLVHGRSTPNGSDPFSPFRVHRGRKGSPPSRPTGLRTALPPDLRCPPPAPGSRAVGGEPAGHAHRQGRMSGREPGRDRAAVRRGGLPDRARVVAVAHLARDASRSARQPPRKQTPEARRPKSGDGTPHHGSPGFSRPPSEPRPPASRRSLGLTALGP
jgi:hypothetical protein